MSGNFSRRKGMRNEYLLRDELRRLGFEANRVPSSGAAEGFKGDVEFTKEGKTRLAELKCRQSAFSKVYAVVDSVPVFSVSVSTPEALELISVSYSLEAVLQNDFIYPTANTFRSNPVLWRGIKRLVSLKKMLGQSDILVVKDDRHPFVYIRYR